MPKVTTGTYQEGKNKGRKWEAYEDPASSTGWTIKNWDPYNPSKEYFGDYNAAAADVDEQNQQNRSAQGAAQQGGYDQYAEGEREYRAAKAREERLISGEKTRQFDVGANQAATSERNRVQQAKAALAEQRRQFDMSFGLQRQDAARSDRRLGLDTLIAGGNLRGPLDAFQGFAFAQGAGQQGLTPYVNALYGGANGPAYGGGTGGGGGSPTPLTLGTLAQEMGAGGGGGGGGGTGTDQYGRPNLTSQQQAYLAPIRSAYEGGLANKGLGYLENMTAPMRDAFKSGGDYIGRDTASEFEGYQRSRPGQVSALRGG
jgi:hypothetical protein